jgi:hypothetical protein
MLYGIIWMIAFPTAAIAAIYLDVRAYSKIRRLYVGAWLAGTAAACLLPYALGHCSYRVILADIIVGLVAICLSSYSNLVSLYPNQIPKPIVRAEGESDAEYFSALNDQDDQMVKLSNISWFKPSGGRYSTRESRSVFALLIFVPLTLLVIGMLISGPAPTSSGPAPARVTRF